MNYLPNQKITDEEIKADILNRLLRKNCWGAKYLPVDTIVNWLSKKVRKNGKRVRGIIRVLVNEGYLLLHKRGETVSLNPTMSKQVVEYIERVIEEY